VPIILIKPYQLQLAFPQYLVIEYPVRMTMMPFLKKGLKLIFFWISFSSFSSYVADTI